MESVASIIRDSTNKQNLNTVKLITLDITLYHSPSSVFTTNSGMKALQMCRTRQIWRAAWLYPSIQRSVDLVLEPKARLLSDRWHASAEAPNQYRDSRTGRHKTVQYTTPYNYLFT